MLVRSGRVELPQSFDHRNLNVPIETDSTGSIQTSDLTPAPAPLLPPPRESAPAAGTYVVRKEASGNGARGALRGAVRAGAGRRPQTVAVPRLTSATSVVRRSGPPACGTQPSPLPTKDCTNQGRSSACCGRLHFDGALAGTGFPPSTVHADRSLISVGNEGLAARPGSTPRREASGALDGSPGARDGVRARRDFDRDRLAPSPSPSASPPPARAATARGVRLALGLPAGTLHCGTALALVLSTKRRREDDKDNVSARGAEGSRSATERGAHGESQSRAGRGSRVPPSAGSDLAGRADRQVDRHPERHQGRDRVRRPVQVEDQWAIGPHTTRPREAASGARTGRDTDPGACLEMPAEARAIAACLPAQSSTGITRSGTSHVSFPPLALGLPAPGALPRALAAGPEGAQCPSTRPAAALPHVAAGRAGPLADACTPPAPRPLTAGLCPAVMVPSDLLSPAVGGFACGAAVAPPSPASTRMQAAGGVLSPGNPQGTPLGLPRATVRGAAHVGGRARDVGAAFPDVALFAAPFAAFEAQP